MAEKHRTGVSNSSSFEKRLSQYGAMSLAIAGAAVGSPAQASVIYYSGHGATATSTSGVSFNFFTGAVNSPGPAPGRFGLSRLNRTTINRTNAFFTAAQMIISGGRAQGVIASPYATGFARALKLGRGAVVGPADNFLHIDWERLASKGVFTHTHNGTSRTSQPFTLGNFQPVPITGYVGVEFTSSGGQLYYGWAEVTIDSQYNTTLDEFAYNNAPNTPITIPSIPEPASILLLTLGAAGLAAYRRKRAAKAN